MIKIGDKFRVTNHSGTLLDGRFANKVFIVDSVMPDRVLFKAKNLRQGKPLFYCLLDCLEFINPVHNDNKELEFLDRLHYNRFNL